MKPLFFFLLAMFVWGANPLQNKAIPTNQVDEDKILWSATRNLTWDDFKGIPPEGSFITVAAIQTEIVFTKVKLINGLPRAEVASYFIKNESWTVTDNLLILEH